MNQQESFNSTLVLQVNSKELKLFFFNIVLKLLFQEK